MAPQNPPAGKGKLPIPATRTPTRSTIGGPSNHPQSLAAQDIRSNEEEDEELVQARVKIRQLEQTLATQAEEKGQL